jgi:hypothetical protein
MKTLWCKNQENPSDRISHAWAPLNGHHHERSIKTFYSVGAITMTRCTSTDISTNKSLRKTGLEQGLHKTPAPNGQTYF